MCVSSTPSECLDSRPIILRALALAWSAKTGQRIVMPAAGSPSGDDPPSGDSGPIRDRRVGSEGRPCPPMPLYRIGVRITLRRRLPAQERGQQHVTILDNAGRWAQFPRHRKSRTEDSGIQGRARAAADPVLRPVGSQPPSQGTGLMARTVMETRREEEMPCNA